MSADLQRDFALRGHEFVITWPVGTEEHCLLRRFYDAYDYDPMMYALTLREMADAIEQDAPQEPHVFGSRETVRYTLRPTAEFSERKATYGPTFYYRPGEVPE